MRTFLLTIATIFCFFSAMNAEIKNITILSTGDTHSCLATGGERDASLIGNLGGITRAATIIQQTKMQDPNTILLHAGDLFIGDLLFNTTFGIPELTLMNSFGFDALTLGNHEFDLTPMVLTLALGTAFQEGGFPVLSANAVIPDVEDLAVLKQIITPYTIVERNGLKIGIFGMTTPETNVLSLPKPIFLDTLIIEIATATVMEMQAKGCDAIVFLSHLGFELDNAVATYVDGINLVIGGHTHLELTEPFIIDNAYGSKVPIIHTGAFYHNMGKTILSIDTEKKKVSVADYKMIRLDNKIEENETVKTMIGGIVSQVEEQYGPMFTQPVAMVEQTFDEAPDQTQITNGRLDTPVGNLVCDAYRDWGKTDIAITAGGSTAQKLYKGPIVANDVFRMIGYGFNEVNGLGFRMVKIKVQGQVLWGGIEFGLKDILSSDEFLIQASGLTYHCDPMAEFGEKVKAIFINEELIDPEKFYTVTTNEFIALVLGELGMPFEIIEASEDMTEFQVVLNYIIAKQSLVPEFDTRIFSPVIENKIENDDLNFNHIAPNPCRESVNIQFSINNPGLYNISIYDINSQKVMNYSKTFCSGRQNETIQINTLNNGIYSVEISNTKNRVTSKFIVVR